MFWKIFFDLQTYNKQKFFKDLGAGITVGIVALPLSLALAIASGVPPILGLYTAGIAGIVAAAFAGSPYSVSGPAAAMVPILVGIVSRYGLEQLANIGILAGIFLIAFGAFGIGKILIKIPETIVLGFTAGVAAVIFFGQLNSFFGLHDIHPHSHFHEKLLETFKHLGTLHLPTVAIGVLTLLIITKLHTFKSFKKVPPTLPAVALATLLVAIGGPFSEVATIGAAYGSVTQGFPPFSPDILFSFDWANPTYIIPAIKIAGLVAVESLLCAMVADKMTKSKHRPNQELAAQGIANIVSPLFSGIPATAVIARTGTIIKADAQTRIAAVIHALIVILFFVALAPIASAIPLSALAAVLLITAIRISEYKEVRHSFIHHSQIHKLILFVTLTLTIFTDLVVGVSAGLFFYMLHRLYDSQLRHKKLKEDTLQSVAEYESEEMINEDD